MPIIVFRYKAWTLAALPEETQGMQQRNGCNFLVCSNGGQIEVEGLSNLVYVSEGSFYALPELLQRSLESRKDGDVNLARSIWSIVNIEERLIPMVRLEVLSREVSCE